MVSIQFGPTDRDNPFILWHRARARNQSGNHDGAIADCNQALDAGPWSTAYAEMGYAYALKRDMPGFDPKKNASQILQKMRELEKDPNVYVDPYEYAMVYAGLATLPGAERQEYTRQAIKYLKEAETKKSTWLISLNAEPKFKSIRNDEQFKQLVKRLAMKPWDN